MKKYISLLIGGISVVATVAIYLLSTANYFKYPMCWLALAFIIISELATSALFQISNGKPIRVACGITALIQTLITLALSIIFINLFVFAFKAFIVWYVLTAVIAAVIVIILFNFDDRHEGNKAAFRQAKSAMISSRAVVNSVINSDASAKYRKELEKLDENLRFSDDSVINDLDEGIYNSLIELSQNILTEDFDVLKAIDNINNLISQRNFIVKNSR